MRWDPRGKIPAPLNFLRRRRLTRLKNITSSIGGSNPPAAGETQDPSPDSPPIRFGTDGWRGRIAQEVTLASLRRLAVAPAVGCRYGPWRSLVSASPSPSPDIFASAVRARCRSPWGTTADF